MKTEPAQLIWTKLSFSKFLKNSALIHRIKLNDKFCLFRAQFLILYSMLHQFRQITFAYDDLFFKLKPIFATAPGASKNDACYINGQN